MSMTLASYYFNQFTTAQYADFCIRLVVAFLVGGMVGLERSKRFKEAGIRTHIIVCVTAALIMLVSKYGFADLNQTTGMEVLGSKGADPARVAAQAVSGISFLCAGVIFKVGSSIKGLTVVVAFTAVLLWLLQYVFYRMPIGAESYDGYQLKFMVKDSEKFEEELRAQFTSWGVQLTSSNITWQRDGVTEFEFVIRGANAIEYTDIKEFAKRLPEVVSFSYSPLNVTHLI